MELVGYSSGISEDMTAASKNIPGTNGCSSPTNPGYYYSTGASYFEVGKNTTAYTSVLYAVAGHLGGQGPGDYQYLESGGSPAKSGFLSCYIGSGGTAGIGGIITKEASANIIAKNGNKYTDGSNVEPLNIYIQNGSPLDVHIHNGCVNSGPNYAQTRYERLLKDLNISSISGWCVASSESNYKDFVVTKSMRTVPYTATSYGQGIGSGAGYIEVSNGEYNIKK